MLDHEQDGDSCQHSHQYMFVSTIILLAVSSLIVVPLGGVLGYSGITYLIGQTKSSNTSSVNYRYGG